MLFAHFHLGRLSCLGCHCPSLTIPCPSLSGQRCLLLMSVLFVIVDDVAFVLVLITPSSISHHLSFSLSDPAFMHLSPHACLLFFFTFPFFCHFLSFFASSFISSLSLTALSRSLSLFLTYPSPPLSFLCLSFLPFPTLIFCVSQTRKETKVINCSHPNTTVPSFSHPRLLIT